MASMTSALAQRTAFAGKAVRAAKPRAQAARPVRAMATADRPVWMPGNPPPAHLDGSLVGDYGFDPLNLGSDPEILKWFVHAELIHCRVAMTGAAGILFTSILHSTGADVPEWYEAGKVSLEKSGIPLAALIWPMVLMSQFVELKRLEDFKNPGSQADGSFLGIKDEFKGNGNGYPGGRFFDPFGLSRGSEAQLQQYKLKEIKNGRLAMVAVLGFFAQYFATGKGPIDNLTDHLADPYKVTFVTNGVSVPFLQ